MDYDLIAIDLDGTLLDAAHRVPARNRAALHAAHEAGLKVVLCTGRSYTETRPVVDQIGLDLDATVTVGGALISEAVTGRTLECEAFPQALAFELIAWLRALDHTVLWLHDAWEAGFDGYIIAGPRRHPRVDQWKAKVPCVFEEADAPPASRWPALRLTVVDGVEQLRGLSPRIERAFGGRATHNVIEVPLYGISVIESFVAPVDKWSGILKLCRRWQIDPLRVVAVGDDVNDLAMVRAAGLGVAVANARPEVKQSATRLTASNDACGVADLIDELLRA